MLLHLVLQGCLFQHSFQEEMHPSIIILCVTTDIRYSRQQLTIDPLMAISRCIDRHQAFFIEFVAVSHHPEELSAIARANPAAGHRRAFPCMTAKPCGIPKIQRVTAARP